MANLETLVRIGNKCYWNDPAIQEYPKRSRLSALKRVFVIVKINGNENGIYTEKDDIILIKDTKSGTEAEVYANELFFI